MLDTTTSISLSSPAVGLGAGTATRGSFPLEHEAEFAEMQAAAPGAGFLTPALAAGLIFHALLITERHVLGLRASFFAVHGAPVTVGLLALVLLPTSRKMLDYSRGLLCAVNWGAVIALVAGLNLDHDNTLLGIETGIAALMLLVGWAARLPFGWTALLTGGMFAANAGALAWMPGGQASMRVDSLFAPAFSVGFALLVAWVRREEARRDFLATRTLAFAGTEVDETAEDIRHLDPLTRVANRAAFDMRLRASWEHATTRRNSVALLMFSIDDFAQKKRDLGHRFGDTLQTQVAAMLKEGLRRSDDMVARFDVQHFVVMLPGVGTDGATQIAERLRGCIEELVIYVGAQRYRATVTVGVASMHAKRGTPREKLIECATQALELGKQNGSNLICVEGRGCLPRMA
ncbi:MAG TPA: GGDEF domain-containing protein [Acidobacteriaceae bacterium]